ncbi:MAG: hypothetical protein CVV24_06545 [Ignavibacteriae bacterium HGW-Ignavibacteriae-3]|nr:MAG: hypothetical protein CVV24_06545 [Ignavibacteriae bacterium HGW-Ignavibacteriae-3]
MIITALQRKGSNVLVCFDESESVVLDYRTVLDNGLRKNDFVDDLFLNKWITESTILKIKDSAYRLLGRRQHSTSELRNKLSRKKYPKDIIEKVLAELADKNILDDEKFAVAYLEERAVKKKIGINKLKSELFRKGIKREIIDKVLLRVDPDLSYHSASELALKKLSALNKKNTDEKKLNTKIYAFLNSRGFESEIIMRVLNELRMNDE